jgi:hypothetical protein
MKKRIIIIQLFTMLYAAVFAQNESEFKMGGAGIIAAYEGWDTEIAIPAQVDGVPVKIIGDNAFKSMGLTSITIPAGVKYIGREAFSVNKLSSVAIPAGAYIDYGVFIKDQLTAFTAGDGVYINTVIKGDSSAAKIGSTGVYVMKDVVLGADVFFTAGTFDEYVYYDYMCNDRKAGTYDTSVFYPDKREGDFRFIETKYGAVIKGISGGGGGRLIIPQQLGGTPVKGMVGRLSGVSRVQLPESITFIGSEVFSGSKLTEITLPAGVTSIGDNAFEKNQLTEVTIPHGVTSIGDDAFYQNQLNFVTIPNSVKFIGSGAFSRNKLSSVTIPNGVTFINKEAFRNNQLKSITIPGSVVFIGRQAFTVNELTDVTIHTGVTYIGERAFSSNGKLTNVTIGANVKLAGNSFPDNFDSFYDTNGKKAGTYVFNNKKWSMK